MTTPHKINAPRANALKAVDLLYHSWITGLVLALVTRKNADTAEEFIFRLFRKQHLERFLPGLEKLGLIEETDAVAAAKYHYFSNQLGGVKVEYYAETDKKAWVRYPPPRWIWEGTAICGIPSEVNIAMLRGWHAHNGVSLGNPRLGFVCTKATADGQPGLEGYYQEYDHDLNPDERLQFKPEEICPRIDPATMPQLDATDWPDERKAKAASNYSMEYIRNALPILIDLLGPAEAKSIGCIAGRQIGMHCYDQIRDLLDVSATDETSFILLLADFLAASGDSISIRGNGKELTRSHWRLFSEPDATLLTVWQSPFEGLLAVHDRFMKLSLNEGIFSIVEGNG